MTGDAAITARDPTCSGFTFVTEITLFQILLAAFSSQRCVTGSYCRSKNRVKTKQSVSLLCLSTHWCVFALEMYLLMHLGGFPSIAHLINSNDY